MLNDFADEGGGLFGLAIGLGIVWILGPILIHPVGGVLVGGTVIAGTVIHLVEYARIKDSLPEPYRPPIDARTLTALPDERVHVAGGVGLILIMVLWILLVLHQFIAAVVLGVLMLMVYGGRLGVDWIRREIQPGRPYNQFDDFEDKVHTQTVFILLITGALLFIAAVVVGAE